MLTQPNEWNKLPFKEAIAFFRQKKLVTTQGWQDLKKSDHDQAFTIAGLTKQAALEEMFNAMHKQFTAGLSFNQFQKDFDQVVAKHGWDHSGDRAWRARTIFDTNFRTAYTAGRWAQLQTPAAKKAFPYIQYKHSGAERYRPEHKRWNGLVLPRDDKFWQTNLPPNGWGCKCKFLPLGQRSLERLGKLGPDRNPYDVLAEQGKPTTRKMTWRDGREVDVPIGVDLGWDYAPGASWQARLLPTEIKAPIGSKRALAKLYDAPEYPAAYPQRDYTEVVPPLPRVFSASKMQSPSISNVDAAKLFLAAFKIGLAETIIFTDVAGMQITIGDGLFIRDSEGDAKLTEARNIAILMLAETLKNPDEIFIAFEKFDAVPGKWVQKRRYVAQWIIDGKGTVALSSFMMSSAGWQASTTLPLNNRQLKKQRVGARVYVRKETP